VKKVKLEGGQGAIKEVTYQGHQGQGDHLHAQAYGGEADEAVVDDGQGEMMKGNDAPGRSSRGAAGDHGRHVHHRPEAVVPGARFIEKALAEQSLPGLLATSRRGGEAGSGKPDYSRRPSVQRSPGAAGRSASDRRRLDDAALQESAQGTDGRRQLVPLQAR